jgi:hypothetical protein
MSRYALTLGYLSVVVTFILLLQAMEWLHAF